MNRHTFAVCRQSGIRTDFHMSYYARVKAYLNLLEQQEPVPFIDGSGGSEVVLQPLDC